MYVYVDRGSSSGDIWEKGLATLCLMDPQMEYYLTPVEATLQCCNVPICTFSSNLRTNNQNSDYLLILDAQGLKWPLLRTISIWQLTVDNRKTLLTFSLLVPLKDMYTLGMTTFHCQKNLSC